MTSATVYKEKPKRKRYEHTVYRPPGHMRAVFSIQLPFILLVTMVFGSWMLYALRTGSLFELLFTGGLFYCTSMNIWLILNWAFIARLIVSPEGIEYNFGGYSGFAFWHDMECLGDRRSPLGQVWGIILNRRIDLMPTQVRSFLPFSSSGPDYLRTFISLNHIVLVQKKGFPRPKVNVNDFRCTPLGQDLFHYAPHLFEGVKAKGKRS